jgi:hypothetical protein
MHQEKVILGVDSVKNENIIRLVLTSDFDQTVDDFFAEARDLFPLDERHIMHGEIHIYTREKVIPKETKNAIPAKTYIQAHKPSRKS